MSAFLDELARSLATPMPRSRAIRVLGVAIASAAVPLLRTGSAAARSGSTFTVACHNKKCPTPPFTLPCKCHVKPTGNPIEPLMCNFICCDPAQQECVCPPGAALCKQKPCDTKCGPKCCTKDEHCACATTGLCCKRGENACVIEGTPGSAETCKGGRCCPRGGTCCQNDKRSSCCEAEDNCCAGRCCPPDKRCNAKTGECGCPKGTQTCGRHCCEAGKNATEKCCDDHCCKSTQQCCGEGCCNKGEKCCGGKCCKPAEGETCCGTDCCTKGEICMTVTQRAVQSTPPSSRATTSRICCPKPRAIGTTRCCPPGTVAGVSASPSAVYPTCCPPGKPDCCEPRCQEGQVCINGTCGR